MSSSIHIYIYIYIYLCIYVSYHIHVNAGALYVSTHNGHNIEQLKYGIEHLMGSLRMMLIERGALDKEEVIGELKTNLGM